MFVTREEFNLSRFGFERTTKRNRLNFETKQNFSLRKLIQNETKPKQFCVETKQNFEILIGRFGAGFYSSTIRFTPSRIVSYIIFNGADMNLKYSSHGGD